METYVQTSGAGSGNLVKLISSDNYIVKLNSVKSKFQYLLYQKDFEKYYKKVPIKNIRVKKFSEEV